MDWANILDRNPFTQQLKKTSSNVFLLLTHAKDWKDVIWYDTFRHRLMRRGSANFDTGGLDSTGSQPWRDVDSLELMMWCAAQGLDVYKAPVEEAVTLAGRYNQRHPLQDELNALCWDGTERLDYWLIDYMGAENTELSRAIGRAWMISAVARAMQPGCQADHCLVLEGRQGLKKSTALQILAGKEYFAEYSAENLAGKDAAMLVDGVWIMEFSELGAVKTNHTETVKSFVTRRADHYRPPYERHTITVPRSCVFAGTTNEDTYLSDETGNRRYWSVRCNHASVVSLKEDRDQLWAEAVFLYHSGEPWHLSKRLEELATAEQKSRLVNDPWLEGVIEYIKDKSDVSTNEILRDKFNLDLSQINAATHRRVAGCLRALGWVVYRTSGGLSRRWKLAPKKHNRASLNPDRAARE
jgi:predicted P-loop ATPase